MAMFYLLMLISLTQIPCIIASHFRGGLLTWTAENASQVSMIRCGIDFFFKLLNASRIVNIFKYLTVLRNETHLNAKHVCFNL